MSLVSIQQRLQAMDLYHGQQDGQWGPETEAAINKLIAEHWAIPSPETGALPPPHEPLAPKLILNHWPTQAAAEIFYGSPGDNLVHIVPPYPMIWDLDPGDGKGKPVNYIVINKGCAESLLRCLKAVAATYASRSALEARHLQWFGGSYANRQIRGGHATSMHAFGAAIDLAPTWNGQHVPYDEGKGMMPMSVVNIFESEGWVWGGRWSPGSIDCMHFQAATIR